MLVAGAELTAIGRWACRFAEMVRAFGLFGPHQEVREVANSASVVVELMTGPCNRLKSYWS